MAITLKLTTEDIRNKMFDFIKPVYKGIYDLDFGYVDWIYGADCPKTNILILRVKLLHINSVLCHLSCQSQ